MKFCWRFFYSNYASSNCLPPVHRKLTGHNIHQPMWTNLASTATSNMTDSTILSLSTSNSDVPSFSSFSSRSDLTLIIGQAGVMAMVESHRLISSSAVFRAMLTGPFKESRPADRGRRWEVRLSDDDPEPLLIILRCLHMGEEASSDLICEATDCRRQALVDIDQEKLLALLKVAEMYDLLGPLRRWHTPLIVSRWFKPAMAKALPIHLTISWHLAQEGLFAQTCLMLAWDIEVHENGNIFFSDGHERTDCRGVNFLLPPSVLEQVVVYRTDILGRLLGPIRTDLKRLRSHKSCQKAGVVARRERLLCGLTALGGIYDLARADKSIAIVLRIVFADQPARTYTSTVRRIVMWTNFLFSCSAEKYPGHETCSPFPNLEGEPTYTFPIRPVAPDLLKKIRARAEEANGPRARELAHTKMTVLGFRVPARRWA